MSRQHSRMLAMWPLLAATLAPAWAQDPAASLASEPAAQRMETPEGRTESAPGGDVGMSRFDAEEATEAYISSLTPEEKERSDSYFEGGYWIQLWSVLLAVGVAWLLLGIRLSARMRDLVERITRRRPIQTMLYVAQYVILTSVLFFPFTFYVGFLREHRYGLATQGFGSWMGDQLMALVVNLIMFSLLATAIYAGIRRTPRRWWVWASGVTVVFLMIGSLIAPVFILPLFNDYTPLEDGPVKEAVLSLARANGVPADQVYQYNASRQTTRIGANVSGFMGTLRISLNDNLLEQGSVGDIKAIMAHEIGHYVLNHAYEGVVYFALMLTLGFACVAWLFDKIVARRGAGWGVRGVSDLAGLPLLVGIFAVYFFLMTPVVNTIIRTIETEADVFGINASAEPDGRARTAMMHAEDRKIDPGPIEEWIFFDHPSGRNRVLMAMRWKAEHLDRASPVPAAQH